MVRALALVLLLGATGAATPAPPPPIEQLADRLRDQTLPFVERAEVLGVRVHQAGPGGAQGDLLALLLARLQAAGMGAADADRATPNSFDCLLDVELTSDGTALTANARLYALAGSLWPIAPRLEHLLYATVALHAPNVPLSTAHGPLALRRRTFAVDGDNDDVRALAVTLAQHVPTVLVAGRDLAAYALTPEGTAVLRWRSALTAPLAASWPRTPLASLAVDETSVVVRSSERARAERHRLLNGAFDDRPAPEPTVGIGGCALEPGVDWFVAHGCGDGRWPARFYAPAARTVDGHGVRAAIALDPDASLWSGARWRYRAGARPARRRAAGAGQAGRRFGRGHHAAGGARPRRRASGARARRHRARARRSARELSPRARSRAAFARWPAVTATATATTSCGPPSVAAAASSTCGSDLSSFN